MRLGEALVISRSGNPKAPRFKVILACGVTPLHLSTFLSAHLQQASPHRCVEVIPGAYGDLIGTVERAATADVIAIALEWTDLDPRFGYRQLGGWGPAESSDAVATARSALERLASAIDALPSALSVAISLPSLPLAPVFHTPGWEASEAELVLNSYVAAFAARTAGRANTRVANPYMLAHQSPVERRFDFKSEVLTGLAYTLPHADALGVILSRLIYPPAPKKGLITDLDDTLWYGIAGEVGAENLAWDLTSHHQIHGIYQQLLRSLAETGVLLGVASKNDPATVQSAFARKDILLPVERLFPIEAHWNAKSASVSRILETWNVGADSVVFVDDSPLELAEVQALHPDMQCLLFPRDDYAAAHAFFRQLRDLFGKSRLSAEDALRLDSIRRSAAFHDGLATPPSADAFLATVDASISFEFEEPGSDARVLELVNKTNQFNLNGKRRTESEWLHLGQRAGAFLGVLSYRDKFGPLGKIAVIQGQSRGTALWVETWVMSCRAFARRVEHQCLRTLLQHFDVTEIQFDFRATSKNGPLREFLEAMTGTPVADGNVLIQRENFDSRCPTLFHSVELSEPQRVL